MVAWALGFISFPSMDSEAAAIVHSYELRTSMFSIYLFPCLYLWLSSELFFFQNINR
jgi:hypothetical protein